jgi:hypothetical protein
MMKLHVANVMYGTGPSAMLAESWRYKGTHLYAAYQSAQIIEDESAGMYSLTWHRTADEIAVEKAREPKPKHPLVAKIARHDPERAFEHVARLARRGLLAPSC